MKNRRDDPHTKRAKKEQFLARSIYKLEDIDRREKLFVGVKRVLDLGASPGSWTQYCLKRNREIHVIAIDLNPIKMSDERLTFLCSSIEEVQWDEILANDPIDLVLSDMAPHTSGQHDVDVARSIELAEQALSVCKKYLRLNGNFVTKVFMGQGFEAFHEKMKNSFQGVKLIRPDATRKRSREIYLIGHKMRKSSA